MTFGPTETVSRGWITSDCTGTAYVLSPPPPRYAFAVTVNGSHQFYVRPDGVQVVQTGIIGQDNGVGCSPGGFTAYAAPLSLMKSVSPPATPPGQPPYHPEVL
jgi:hypothetical protein